MKFNKISPIFIIVRIINKYIELIITPLLIFNHIKEIFYIDKYDKSYWIIR